VLTPGKFNLWSGTPFKIKITFPITRIPAVDAGKTRSTEISCAKFVALPRLGGKIKAFREGVLQFKILSIKPHWTKSSNF